jgi:hypothetical protein
MRWSGGLRKSMGAGALLALLWASPAHAGQYTVTVSPDEGLQDGDTVTVRGQGFPPSREWTSNRLALCEAGIDFADEHQERCADLGGYRVHDDNTFERTARVRRSRLAFNGEDRVTCGAEPEDCEIVAVTVVNLGTPRVAMASAPISFGPEPK